MTTQDTRPPTLFVLELEGEAVQATIEPDFAIPAPFDVVASYGGVGLALGALARAMPDASSAGALAIGVGPGVVRGLPTAARATLFGRAALGGRLAQGQVGGSLGARLAVLADALVVRGRATGGRVLVVDANGRARLESVELPDDLLERNALLARRHETDAILCVGRAAERGVRFASIAVGGESPSFVGRGGLGLTLVELGLVAIVFSGAARSTRAQSPLTASLAASPRLLVRSEEGSLELWDRADSEGEVAHGGALAEQARGARATQHGCRGCPTPCGWTFERPGGKERGARFAAMRSLGAGLGVESFDDALRLLERANAVGVDAKELGAVLKASGIGSDVEELARAIDALGEAESRLGLGVVALDAAARTLHSQVVLSTRDPARLLGQCVGGGGVDPMRSFSVLTDVREPAHWRRWLEGTEITHAMLDSRTLEGKGRLVAFSEELAAAVDLVGFCAFSTGALLADGLVELDELARELGLVDAKSLRVAGASFALARRILDEAWGFDPRAETPDWCQERVGAAGMLPEYRSARGLSPEGRVLPTTLAKLGTRDVLVPKRPLAAGQASRAASTTAKRVELVATGELAERLIADLGPAPHLVDVPAPGTVEALLETLSERSATARFLGPARPIVIRRGDALPLTELLVEGDRLDLVLAVAGG